MVYDVFFLFAVLFLVFHKVGARKQKRDEDLKRIINGDHDDDDDDDDDQFSASTKRKLFFFLLELVALPTHRDTKVRSAHLLFINFLNKSMLEYKITSISH